MHNLLLTSFLFRHPFCPFHWFQRNNERRFLNFSRISVRVLGQRWKAAGKGDGWSAIDSAEEQIAAILKQGEAGMKTAETLP